MKYYLNAFKNYANFKGRSTRKEYWLFALIHGLIAMTWLTIACKVAEIAPFASDFEKAMDAKYGFTYYTREEKLFFLLFFVYLIALLLPSLAYCVRRLHDAGFSGWMFFIVFVPIAGIIALIVLFALPSKPGINKYGPNKNDGGEFDNHQSNHHDQTNISTNQ